MAICVKAITKRGENSDEKVMDVCTTENIQSALSVATNSAKTIHKLVVNGDRFSGKVTIEIM